MTCKVVAPVSPPRALLLAGLLLLLGSCHAGLDPERLLGRWTGPLGEIEFFPDGRVHARTQAGSITGSYARVSRSHIRVDLGGRWASGEPKLYRALARGDQLALCELQNYRHCLQYHRPGAAVRLHPR